MSRDIELALLDPDAPHEQAVDWATGETFAVHPLAARFPPLPADELADLAADIAAHGLQVPILLDVARQLLDGRNRLRACAVAEVAPRYATFAGDDPAAAIIALNVHRRHITQGARSMAVALERLVTRRSTRAAAKAAGASRAGVGQATIVLQYAPELADRVMHGDSLQDAYAVAQQRKAEREADAGTLGRLRRDYPALAAEVDAGDLTIAQAAAAAAAIEWTAADDRRHAQLREQIVLEREAIGTPVPLPSDPPDLTLRFTAKPDGSLSLPTYAQGLGAVDLAAEHGCLLRWSQSVQALNALCAEPPLVAVSWADGHLNAARSTAQQIVAAAYRLVEAHEQAYRASTGIRSVK